MRVKILQVPKTKLTLPENRINPFSVPDEFKYGGRLENRGNQNGVPIQALDTYSDYLRQPDGQNGYMKSPYASTGKQLPDVPKEDNPDIVVEKKEQVMGDFNGDGMPVLMGVNTGSHESGNDQGINVPDGSFVFSDTPSLKIKDPQLLDMFGVKKATTPAQIAKQYDLQRYKKILDDPDKGSVDKNTAKLMYTNYTNKLNTLASIQEDMKQRQDMMKAGAMQSAPQMRKGGKTTKPMNRYDDVFDVNNYDAAQPTDYASQVPAKKGTGKSKQVTPPTYNPEWNWDGVMPVAPNQYPANDIPNYLPARENIAPLREAAIPDTQYPGPSPMAVPPLPEIKGAGRQHPPMPPGMNLSPDALAAITAGLRYGQYPDYNPVRQVAHGAYAEPVFADPTRAKAAIQEQVNSAGNSIAMGANGPIARANILALQGKAGAEAANIESQYAQKNAEIATRTNEQAAGLYNQLWKDQQGYNKDYAEETHNAQMDKLGYQFGVQNELLKQAYLAENRKRTAQNYNYINPYYTMDSRGYIYPKSEAQLKAVQSIGNGPTGGTSSSTPIQDAEAIIKAGTYTPEAIAAIRQKAAIMHLYQMQGPKQSRTYNPTTGGYTPSKETGYGDAFDYQQKRGGPISKGITKMRILALPK